MPSRRKRSNTARRNRCASSRRRSNTFCRNAISVRSRSSTGSLGSCSRRESRSAKAAASPSRRAASRVAMPARSARSLDRIGGEVRQELAHPGVVPRLHLQVGAKEFVGIRGRRRSGESREVAGERPEFEVRHVGPRRETGIRRDVEVLAIRRGRLRKRVVPGLEPGELEVDEAVAMAVEQDVRRLEVVVHQALAIQREQSVEERRQCARVERVAQRIRMRAGQVSGQQKMIAARFDSGQQAVGVGDPGLRQPRDDRGFARERDVAVRALRPRARRLYDGHVRSAAPPRPMERDSRSSSCPARPRSPRPPGRVESPVGCPTRRATKIRRRRW